MKTAVVVIDVQKALTDPEPRPYDIDGVIERINLVTEQARGADIPVIFVHHEAEGSPLEYGTDGWQLPDMLNFVEGDVRVRKTTPDSFLGTNLKETLDAKGVTKLVICGYASEFCVDTTTRKAASLGYDVDLISDAHTTHDKPHATGKLIQKHHTQTLSDLTSFGVKIQPVSSEEVSF